MLITQQSLGRGGFFASLVMVMVVGCGAEAPPSVTRIAPDQVKVTIDSAPAKETAEDRAAFTFSCDSRYECTFYCRLDDEKSRRCISPTLYEGLSDGEYRFEVWAVDEQEVESEVVAWEWAVDRRAPEITELSGPVEVTPEIAATFTFGCDKGDCTFECSLSGRSIERCESGVTYHGLFDGDYLFAVRAQDRLGNVGATKNWEWRVDSTPPEVVELGGPPELTGATSAEFDFGCSEEGCLYECALDDGPWESCESGVAYHDLEDGSHRFQVQATDLAGLKSEVESWLWAIDSELPAVVGLSGPVDPTNQTDARFEFECSKGFCRYECALESAEGEELLLFEECERGVELEELADGIYRFLVIPFDEIENKGAAASWTWQVDTAEPEVEFVEGPQAEIYEDWATFDFECADEDLCEFECQLSKDGLVLADFEDCQPAVSLGDLETGEYQFMVRARDRAGNQGTGQWNWAVLPWNWQKVVGGGEHSCGIGVDGALWCWGDNRQGQLGLGDKVSRSRPARVGDGQDWIDIEAGREYSCGIRQGGSLWCWGNNNLGRLGDGTMEGRVEPVAISPGEVWLSVSAGATHTCGIRADHSLWCWGYNYYGQLGDNSGVNALEPKRVAGSQNWATVAVGGEGFTCGLTQASELWCWGRNSEGQVGDGTTTTRQSPRLIGSNTDWEQLSAGAAHSCGLRQGGSLWCWGKNAGGALGDGTEENRGVPTEVFGEKTWATINMAIGYSCALDGEGAVWCWGEVEFPIKWLVPTALTTARPWVDLGGSGGHSCGVDEERIAWCFGPNNYGQIGDGSADFAAVPVPVLRP